MGWITVALLALAQVVLLILKIGDSTYTAHWSWIIVCIPAMILAAAFIVRIILLIFGWLIIKGMSF